MFLMLFHLKVWPLTATFGCISDFMACMSISSYIHSILTILISVDFENLYKIDIISNNSENNWTK